VDVFFDNLQVIHTKGPLLETTDYYPFGLTMAGISSKALNFGDPENNKLYNKGSELQHKEFSDGSGLEVYDTHFRQLDPQLGRWWQIDPKPDMTMSPYSAMNNNPILHNDPLGDTGSLPLIKFVRYEKKDEPEHTEHLSAASKQEWKDNPSGALLTDISYYVADFFGATTIDNAASTLKNKNASTGDKLMALANVGLATSKGDGEKMETPNTGFSDNATVVRGGLNTVEKLKASIDTHPSGVTGVSVECGTCSVKELAKPLPHNQVGITTVGDVRNAGGDVIKTSGSSPNHATLTGLTAEQMNQLLTPTVPNPFKHQ
jgi:RHS repeat-associated protein